MVGGNVQGRRGLCGGIVCISRTHHGNSIEELRLHYNMPLLCLYKYVTSDLVGLIETCLFVCFLKFPFIYFFK